MFPQHFTARTSFLKEGGEAKERAHTCKLAGRWVGAKEVGKGEIYKNFHGRERGNSGGEQ